MSVRLWETRVGMVVVLLSLMAVHTAAADIKPGDEVVLTSNAPLMDGANVCARLAKGTRFTVTGVQGEWVSGEIDTQDGSHTGWVERRLLALSSGGDAPDQPTPTASPAGGPVMRKWMDSSGKHSVEAAFLGLERGMVKLKKKDGGTVAIRLDRLSEADQAFVGAGTKGSATATQPGQSGADAFAERLLSRIVLSCGPGVHAKQGYLDVMASRVNLPLNQRIARLMLADPYLKASLSIKFQSETQIVDGYHEREKAVVGLFLVDSSNNSVYGLQKAKLNLIMVRMNLHVHKAEIVNTLRKMEMDLNNLITETTAKEVIAYEALLEEHTPKKTSEMRAQLKEKLAAMAKKDAELLEKFTAVTKDEAAYLTADLIKSRERADKILEQERKRQGREGKRGP